MITDGFYDAMFDPSFDSTSTDFSFGDNWNFDSFEGYYNMTDQAYQTNAWKSKPITSWTSNEILHWMCNEATTNKRNYEDVKLQNFVDVTSEKFCDMSLDEFIRLAESFEDGHFFYSSKETLLRNNHLDYSPNLSDLVHPDVFHEQRPSRLSFSSTEDVVSEKPVPLKKKPGRPPKPTSALRRKPEKRMGNLWEFLRNLLLDAKTCPSLIKWDNYQEGTFKFVQSEKVAKLWGDRKKNDKMNYEKLSRAMRYYYRSRVLQPVAGKRLVYKFGPAATGWKTENPILEQRREFD